MPILVFANFENILIQILEMSIYKNAIPCFRVAEYLHEVVLSEFNLILAKICRIDLAVFLGM